MTRLSFRSVRQKHHQGYVRGGRCWALFVLAVALRVTRASDPQILVFDDLKRISCVVLSWRCESAVSGWVRYAAPTQAPETFWLK